MKVVLPTPRNLDRAAKALRDGKLVVMPTETVYGLAADAMNSQAVHQIFLAKGRPADNPLIVHIAELSQVDVIARSFPPTARILADRFWPGSLTLVLPKREGVSRAVTGGLETVAVRMPSHPVARALIGLAGPLAAPSANRFMKLSPTRVEHLDPVLLKKVALVLDGGPSEIGVESTVVDCTGEVPRILRPGGVSRGEIEAALGAPLGTMPPDEIRRAPGMYQRHYAPRAVLKLVSKLTAKMPGLTLEEPLNDRQIKMPPSVGPYSSMLYDSLHRLDSLRVRTIYVQAPPATSEWETVRDRLTKASEPR